MLKIFTTHLLLLFTLIGYSQTVTDYQSNYQLEMNRSKGEITLDGILDDDGWQEVKSASPFRNHWPLDTGVAAARTEVFVTYDENFFYVAAKLYDHGERIIQSLKRDSEGHWSSDAFTVVLDPVNQRSSGFMFGVNAGGAQMEGDITSKGGSVEGSRNWDNKWYSEIAQFEDHWSVEIAIPFKSLRYNSANTTWGINFIRNDMERNEYSTWTEFPRNFRGINMAYYGALRWDKAPKPANGKVVLIPYTSGGVSRDFEENEPTKGSIDVGADAKIAITSTLNLDLTVNPDFSNIDVDQQVTNLERFSIFFPERRNFFLENSDVFSNFGSWGVRPFFSRQIGIRDGSPIPILYGARLSGNINKGLRIGILDVQTKATDEANAENYAVAAFHQRVLGRSTVRGLFANRQSTEEVEGVFQEVYNRTAGGEFEYVSKGGKLTARTMAHISMNPATSSDNGFYGATLDYNDRRGFIGMDLNSVGRNFVADMGFTPRLHNYDAVLDTTVRMGYHLVNPWMGLNFFPSDNSKINRHGPRTWHMIWLNEDGSFQERRSNFAYNIGFANRSNTFFRLANTDVRLPVPTDLVGGDEPLPVDRYNFTNFVINHETDSRKKVSGNAFINFGEFYNGTRLGFGGTVNLRAQPWGNFGISYTQNRIELPGNYGSTDLILIGTQAEVSFSNKMFWTSFLQYNTQAGNFNINSRFQWRYKPMSDLFIVYSENYATDGLNVKNRGIVFKLTYWLNM